MTNDPTQTQLQTAKGTSDGELWAVDVQMLGEEHISWKAIRQGADPLLAPRIRVALKDTAPESVAILSWRWDRDLYDGRSRNVALALQHAWRTGKKWLFLDIVSVDQSLSPEHLVKEVASLAELFLTYPVFVTGDRADVKKNEWGLAFRRPWMLYESRTYVRNQNDISYLGIEQPKTSAGASPLFSEELNKIKRTGFSLYIFYVLHGYIRMGNPYDFKYILRPFFSVFEHLERALIGDDYLLSIFLICAMHEETQTVDRGGKAVDNGYRINFHDLGLDRNSFQRFSLGDYESSGFYENMRTIMFDGRPVAEWRSKQTSSFDRCWIKVLPDSDQVILDVTVAPEHVRRDYADNEADRMSWLFLDKDAPDPTVNQFAADIDSETWRQV